MERIFTVLVGHDGTATNSERQFAARGSSRTERQPAKIFRARDAKVKRRVRVPRERKLLKTEITGLVTPPTTVRSVVSNKSVGHWQPRPPTHPPPRLEFGFAIASDLITSTSNRQPACPALPCPALHCSAAAPPPLPSPTLLRVVGRAHLNLTDGSCWYGLRLELKQR
jgi:hypothetical protein